MSFQAYIDAVKTKTGKSPDDFRKLAAKKNFSKIGEVVAWLKADFELGHGHANAIAQLLLNADKFKAAPEDKLAAHFAGDKAKLRKPFDALAAKLAKFGADLTLLPNSTYINVLRGAKKIAIVQISTVDRIDIGIKLKEVAVTKRFEAAGAWNSMVTHRVRISDAKEIDAELLGLLKQAYLAVV